jgi:hypothetical protein
VLMRGRRSARRTADDDPEKALPGMFGITSRKAEVTVSRGAAGSAEGRQNNAANVAPRAIKRYLIAPLPWG